MKRIFIPIVLVLAVLSSAVFAQTPASSSSSTSQKNPPIKDKPTFSSDEDMQKATQNFDALYRGVAFLTLMGSKDAQKDVKSGRSDRNTLSLRAVCKTLVYRLGTKTPMSLKFNSKAISGISVSLQDESDSYKYILMRPNPLLLFNRYTDGGKYRRYLRDRKGSLAKSRGFVEWNKDYLPFADTISYYIGSLSKGVAHEPRNLSDPVYKKYRDSLCSETSFRYSSVQSMVNRYSQIMSS